MIERLFVYGSLQPGSPNEHVLAAIGGDWVPAAIRGELREEGWGAALGYPGIVLDPAGNEVQGQLFMSANLTAHWAELDAFEGEAYARVPVSARLESGECVDACVYALRR